MATHDEPQPTSVEVFHELFMRYVNEGNLDGVVNLYEPDAVFIGREGEVLSKSSAIRDLYRGLLAMTPEFQIQPSIATIYASDLALDISEWRYNGKAPDGSEISDGGRSYVVCRRQSDDTWKIVIDNAYSYGAVPPTH
jgi:ketosteroid isomerase-like protein